MAHAALVVVLAGSTLAAAEPAPPPRPVVDPELIVRAHDVVNHGKPPVGEAERKAWLEQIYGPAESLRPALEAILADGRTDPFKVFLTFNYVANANLGGPRFIELALNRLTDPRPGVRWGAVEYLGRMGGLDESSPLVALLSDKNRRVGYATARALSQIGGRGDLVAMDIWLRSGAAQDESHAAYVKKWRDELEKRLKTAAPAPRPKP